MSTRTKDRLIGTLQRNAKEDGCSMEAAMRDVLTDLMHISETQGVDFDRMLASATEVFEEEKEEVLGCSCGAEVPKEDANQHIAQCSGDPDKETPKE